MKQVITRDNSITFYNEEYDETYHSVTGAVEEAFKKFVEPAMDFVKHKNKVSILDVGFGLGYNSGAAIDRILELNPGCRISIVGLEKDKKILGRIKSLQPNIKTYHVIKDTVENSYKYDGKGIKINLVVCDALESVKKINMRFDIILHDPFSPRKNPELWTESFFKELRKHIKEDGVLTTYSCARLVRENLRRAGFKVFDGPRVGRRAPSTIATPIQRPHSISG